MRIAIYARCSTQRQDTENQLRQLREFAEKQGWVIYAEYIDYESGKTDQRPQFQAMFTAASKREFDCLLFWSLDRLSREGALETLQHLNRLTGYGVAYRSYTEQYLDSTGMFRDAIVSILATLAKQERVRLSERTRAGLAVARSRGRQLGRPKLDVDVAEIARLRDSGLSLRAIAKKLGVSEGTIRKLASKAA